MIKLRRSKQIFLRVLFYQIFYCLFIFIPLFSQNNAGCEFWIAYTRIPWEKENHLYIYITSDNAAKGKVICNSQNFERRFALRPNELVKIEIPRKILIDSTEIISNKGVLIESDKPVIVSGLNYQEYGSEAFLALPKESIGKEYFAVCYPGIFPSHVLCVANENNTKLYISPTVELENYEASPIRVTLNKGQTYLLRSIPQRDLTGSYIKSNKPISVFSGNFGAFIPNVDYCCANHLVEQLPPLNAWGKEYYTSPLANKTKGDVYKITASQENSAIYIDGDSVTTLNAGGFFETILSSSKVSRIISNNPILVTQFSTSNQYDSIPRSDPFMSVLSPVEQFSDEYKFIVPDEGFAEHYLNITAPEGIHNNFILDNKLLYESPESDSIRQANPFSLPISPGSHTIRSNDYAPFSINVYGYNRFDAYGYSAAMNLEEINCGILRSESFSIGASVSLPFSFGGQVQYNYKKYNIMAGYLYAPKPAWGASTEPPDSLQKDNYQHTIFVSPGYIFPLNCKFLLFGGPYIAFGFRYWKNLAENIDSPPYYTGVLSGYFIEYYFGIHAGIKYYFHDSFYLQLSGSINMQTTHRFYDQKILSPKPGGILFLSLNYYF
jgi:hypothetical protein